ncbi:MAG: hypothetical protein WDZ45_03850 [Flavobacteriaceae bacterium]
MRFLLKSFLIFFFFANVSCGVKKSFRDDASLLIYKASYFDSNISSHPYYKLKFYVNLQENYKKVTYPSLDALYPNCGEENKKDEFDYTQEIESWADILSLKIKYPLFILENEKGDLKYFKNYKNDVDKNTYKGLKIYRNKQLSPDCMFLSQQISSRRTGRVNNIKLEAGEHFFGSIPIYLIDLKIKDSDSLTRLHYVTDKHIFSSNWIEW